MKRAVDGCRARISRTCSPSPSPPPALMTWPSTIFSPGSCRRGSKRKLPPSLRRLNRPAGERSRHLGHVLLRVAAIHPERMELHQLAPVVLVEALRRVLFLRGQLVHLGKAAAESLASETVRSRRAGACVGVRTVGVRAHPVVEVEEHRRTLRGRAEQVAESSQHVRPDRLALVLGQQEPIGALARVDVEVVEPEIDQHFLQLALAVRRAEQFLLGQLDHHQVGSSLLFGCGRFGLVAVLRPGLPFAPAAPSAAGSRTARRSRATSCGACAARRAALPSRRRRADRGEAVRRCSARCRSRGRARCRRDSGRTPHG